MTTFTAATIIFTDAPRHRELCRLQKEFHRGMLTYKEMSDIVIKLVFDFNYEQRIGILYVDVTGLVKVGGSLVRSIIAKKIPPTL